MVPREKTKRLEFICNNSVPMHKCHLLVIKLVEHFTFYHKCLTEGGPWNVVGAALIDGSTLRVLEGLKDTVGAWLGTADGSSDTDGCAVPEVVGSCDTDGCALGTVEGSNETDGTALGRPEGSNDTDGCELGLDDGCSEMEGAALGRSDDVDGRGEMDGA